MKKLRQVLKLGLYAKMAIRAIHRSVKLSVGAIQKILSRAKTLSLTWEAVEQLDDVQLANLFYPRSDNQPSTQFETNSRQPTNNHSLTNPANNLPQNSPF